MSELIDLIENVERAAGGVVASIEQGCSTKSDKRELADARKAITDEFSALLSRAEKAEGELSKWKQVASMLADELNDANSERFPISWEDASESSPAWIAYVNLRDRR